MKISQKGEIVLNEKIRDQVTINTEAKEIIQDLFPKIPDNDLFQIIKTAFQLGDNKVGTAEEIPLVRRAQLAVVAHIRHGYTQYDRLLRQVPYNEARHMVEKETLRKIIDWRGDDDEKNEANKRAVEDAVREIVVLSEEEESESELEEGQVPENGKSQVSNIQKVARPTLATEHRALSAAEMSSEEEPPIGYRFVPQIPRRNLLPPTRDDIVARQQSRYAVWDQVRQEYRSGVPYSEPSQTVTRIPLDSQALPHSPRVEPTFARQEPGTRYVIDEAPPVRTSCYGSRFISALTLLNKY